MRKKYISKKNARKLAWHILEQLKQHGLLLTRIHLAKINTLHIETLAWEIEKAISNFEPNQKA